jgi:hypothetical protein
MTPYSVDISLDNSSNLTKETILHTRFIHSPKGFIVGENHYHSNARDFVFNSLNSLSNVHGVKTIYLELPNELQPYVNKYMDPTNPANLMSSVLEDYLNLVYYMIQCDGRTHLDIIMEAKKQGVENIIFFDKETYHINAKPGETPDRCLLVNQYFASLYDSQSTSLTLCGNYHATTTFYEHVTQKVHGLSEISGLPVLDIKWTSGEERTGLFFYNNNGKTPKRDKKLPHFELLEDNDRVRKVGVKNSKS